MAQIKIRSYKNNFKEYKEVALAQNIFFTAYERWNNGEVGIDIIKAMLPADEEKALDICLKGVILNGVDYIAYTSTPNMQKKEKGAEKCEMWFIKKDKADFIPYFENLISLGTLKKFEGEEICINKKVTSRIALAMSSTTKIDFVPRIAVVPNKEIELLQDVIWYTSKDNKLVEHTEDNKLITLTQYDGFGLINNDCAEAIQKSLELNYKVDFSVIRLYGLAVKGLCLRFDWIDYIKNYCDSKFIVKDIWKNNVDLRNVDIILTETQAKWWENFADIDDYYTKLNECVDKDLVECLYITKINKPKTKEYSLTNYQLMSNLSLDINDFNELSKPTVELYQKVINGDLAAIKYFLKDFENEEGEIIPANKAEYLLNVNDDFLRSSMVVKTVNNAILKSVAQLSSGKFYLKGNYKIMFSNPFLLINNLIGIDKVTLNKNEFYIPKNNNKKFTISRNPLASCWEIINIQTVDNKLFDRYFANYTDEIIFFNNFDYAHAQLSQADFDADGVLCIEKSIIYNNVIFDNRKFLHVAEGKTVKKEYNIENKFEAIIKTSGNKIGQLSITGAKISNSCLYGTKENIIDNFYKNSDKLLYLTELEMQVIDAPKTLALPTKQELEVIDIKQDKPLFLKYKDGYYKKNKTKTDNLSYYEQFAEKIINELLKPCVKNTKHEGTDIICKYIYTQGIAVNENCLSDISNFKDIASPELQNCHGKLKLYKHTLLKYQIIAEQISSKYKHRDICNSLVKLGADDKFICNFFFEEIKIKLNELDLKAKVLQRCDYGEHEFFGHKYNLVEAKLIEDNLQYKEIKQAVKKYDKKGKTGIISIGKCDVDVLDEMRVIIELVNEKPSINLYKGDTLITYAFDGIKDTDNKKTTDTLYECSTINIVDILKVNEKNIKVKIEY